ncbi:hypothetical protein, partial [Pseudomonas sp. GW460-8]|uniref:hypothetical protein n=1 Tax=Pseudomonas sp. GW460-8 TaxID=2070608 RepID=UPI001304C5FD
LTLSAAYNKRRLGTATGLFLQEPSGAPDSRRRWFGGEAAGYTPILNSIYNGMPMEDVRLDK